MVKTAAVATYARMWPRELFNYQRGRRPVVRDIGILSKPGVYVLYRNDVPYYVGTATRLRSRLNTHANRPASKFYNFWNYFSVFVVEDSSQRHEFEGILIAAMPTANGAKPRISKERLPADVRKQLHERMHQRVQLSA